MVWAEDVLAGRMGSAVFVDNAVGGDGFIAEVTFSFGVRADDKKKVERDEWRREMDVAWRSGRVGWLAYVAFREKMKTNREEKNEVKKVNEAKMERNEVKPMVAEAMVMDEELTVTGLVAAGLGGMMQLEAACGTVAGEWAIGSMAGSDGDAAVAEVTRSQQQQQRLQWEMFKKGFELAQGMTLVVAGMVVGSVVADLAILEVLSIWSNHIDKANDATEDAAVTAEMTATTAVAAEVADDAKEPAMETRKKMQTKQWRQQQQQRRQQQHRRRNRRR